MYHDITSKYNRNFNANLLIDETMASLDAAYQEDYSKILPLYPHVDKENPTQVADPMDQAIEKASVAIAIHRPSHWTDDNYLIIARAQFIKEDFESAEATLRYLVKHYDPKNLASASQRARNVNEKLSEREEMKEKKVLARERTFKIKERKKAVRKSRNEKKKKAKARKDRIRQRKTEIKEREKMAKQRSKSRQPVKEVPKVTAEAPTKKSKKKERKPFEENPELPKIKGDPTHYFLKHKPAFQEAQLLLAKTLIERDRFGEAQQILTRLQNDAGTFDEIKEELYVVQAHGALSRGQDASAVAPLKAAVEHSRNREKKAHYAFVLAQVLEKTNQYREASMAYDQVIKLKPDYTKNFNASLRKLQMQWNTDQLNDKDFERTIKRLIRDDKNEEYRDQLYYALAVKDLKRGNRKEAITNLSQAVKNSAGNRKQKAEAYYTIATLHFEDENYVKAKYYFDSTLTVMPKQDVRFEEVQTFAKNLDQIADHLELITLQDSLIRISQMSDKEVKELASQIKKKLAAQEAAAAAQAAKAAKPDTRSTALNQAVRQGAAGAAAGSNFFAYDDKQVKKGLREFDRKWGNISLEDDWRRSNRASFESADTDSEGEQVATGNDYNVIAPISKTEIEEIFKDVPKSEADLKAAYAKIEEALFKLGGLFRSELENERKSIESLEELLQRFPETTHALDAFYMLYVSYMEIPNREKADLYAAKINDQHGDSEYAKYINNPEYLKNVLTEEEKIEQYYAKAHDLYNDESYQDAFRHLRDAGNHLPSKHDLQSKFSLLSAMCIGRIRGREPYVNALKDLIAKYPDTEEEKRAKEIIRLLGIRFTDTNDGIEEINPDSYFSMAPNDKLHVILVALKNQADGKVQNASRIAISNYNKKYHRLDELKVATIVIDDGNGKKIPLFVIRRFDTREKAVKYYDGVQKNIGEFIEDPNSYEVFACSQPNYRKIVQLKSIDLYRTYFVQEYLSK